MKGPKPKIILDIEQQFGFELKEVRLNLVGKNTAAFSRNEKGDIMGLSIRNKSISNIECLKDLHQLKMLVLNDTQIQDIQHLKHLKSIQVLRISKNKINNIDVIEHLSDLRGLDISNTYVHNIDKLQNLAHLRTINAQNCRIKTLSSKLIQKFDFINWDNSPINKKIALGHLYLYGNPLPEKIKNRRINEVFNYFRKRQETRSLNEVKILLVGDSGSGKTSLIRQLVGQSFNQYESQTHGIRIQKHEIKYKDDVIRLNFWDFGGQEINHSMHQFFYSKRSLYVLVLDARQEQKAEYWLKHIESFGENSPAIIILNKVDENPSFEVNRRFLSEKFKRNIDYESFYRVSCKTGEGIEDLRKFLYKKIYNMNLRRIPLSYTWFLVKKELSEINSDYISYEKFTEICLKHGVPSLNERDTLRELLHDLGLAIDFEKLRRHDKQVLNPKWITNGVYRIINSPIVGGKGGGVLHFNELYRILHNWARYNSLDDKSYQYSLQSYSYIIDIMQKFELCYELDHDKFIIPDLLPIEEPKGLDYISHPLHFVIRYEDLLPRSVMPNFMVQMHKRIPEGTDKRWRTGVVIREPLYKASAIVRADYVEKEIHIWVKGEERRQMLSFIRKTFERIHDSFPKLNVSESVIISEAWSNHEEDKPYTVKYSTLIAHESKNRQLYFCPELKEDFRVVDLLNGVETPESRRKTPKLRAFISYSHKDDVLKDEFKVAVTPLTRSEFNIEFWDDREIEAGEEWEKEILSELNRSDLIFLLISSDSIASDHIWYKEVSVAISRHNANEAIVIPVILRPCDWKNLDFAKIQVVPEGGMPITKWDNQDEAWLDTVKQIREVLQSGRLEKLHRR